jgi:hypothetical protein
MKMLDCGTHRNHEPGVILGSLPAIVSSLTGLKDLPMPKKLIVAPAEFTPVFASRSNSSGDRYSSAERKRRSASMPPVTKDELF